MSVNVRSAYNNPSERVAIDCSKGNRARQEFKDECDINRIMKKYAGTGVLPQRAGGMFGDFSGIGDFMDAHAMIDKAKEAFASLPSDVRKRFANDPAELIRFVSDVANREEAIKLGLIPKVVVDVKEEAKPNPGPDAKPGDSK